MREQDKKVLRISGQLMADYRATFSTAAGKRVLEDLSIRCFVKTPTFKDFDTNAMVYREGRRSVFLHIQTMMRKEKKK